VALFAAALFVLHRELAGLTWRVLSRGLVATPVVRLGSALLFTMMSYAVLAGYDLLGFQAIHKRMSAANVALASFLSYAVAHNIGFSIVSGASIRYRFYTRWGVSATELSQIIVSYSVTFWLGVCVLGGLSLILAPPSSMFGMSVAAWAPVVGTTLLLVPAVFVAMTAVRRDPPRLAGLTMPWPSPGLASLQVVASVADWALTAAVLFVLLPAGAISFWAFVGPFLIAVLAGGASHVPGGLGIVEGTLVVLLQPYLNSAELVPRLVVYRLCYYLLPFAVALVALTADELHQRRAAAARLTTRLGEITEQITPALFGALAFVAGVVLLFSGATPAARGRLDLLQGWASAFQSPRVIGGTFNMLAGDSAYTDMAALFVDAWPLLAGTAEYGFTMDATIIPPYQAGRVDYWFQEPVDTHARASEMWVVKTMRSGHHALVADVEVK